MKVIYVSSYVTDLQKNLLKALGQAGIPNKLFAYSLRTNAYRYEKIENEIFYQCKSRCRGPLLYINRLNRVCRAFAGEPDLLDADLLHANMMSAEGYICRRLSEKRNIPYVVSVRNTDIHLWFLWRLPWIKRLCYRNLLHAKAIVFLSRSYVEKLLEKFPAEKREPLRSKCVIVPNGIDDFWFENLYAGKRELTDAPIRLITAGRIEENKNQLTVVKAIDELMQKTGRKFVYTVVGDVRDDDMRVQLERFDFVELKPHMKKEELIYEFRKSDIYIMASHTETFGLVYAEAMTQGLPVIYTRGQGFDEQFEEGLVGFSVDSRDVRDIAEGIRKTIERYSLLSSHATEHCEKFRWSCVAQALKDVYDR